VDDFSGAGKKDVIADDPSWDSGNIRV